MTGMTPRDFHKSQSEVEPHAHAVFVYDDDTDLLVPLEAFLEGGSRARDLSVFVHSFPTNDEARSFLRQKVTDLPKYEHEGDLTTARYIESFERGGHIDHDHVGNIIEMLQTSARQSGRRAPRIFVDASKNYFDSGRVDEWFEFEAWLGPKLKEDVGLVCAYRARDLEDPEVLARVLATHAYRFDAPGGYGQH